MIWKTDDDDRLGESRVEIESLTFNSFSNNFDRAMISSLDNRETSTPWNGSVYAIDRMIKTVLHQRTTYLGISEDRFIVISSICRHFSHFLTNDDND